MSAMKFEAYEDEPGNYRWRLRNEHGEIVRIKPGRIMGLKDSAAKVAASERIANEALKRLAERHGRSTKSATRPAEA